MEISREIIARAMFDSRPHNLLCQNPDGTKEKITPNWSEQPTEIKAVFYKEYDEFMKELFNECYEIMMLLM